MVKKYGKSYGDIASIKTNFTADNNELLKKNDRIRNLYIKQPKRITCKLCGKGLANHKVFKSHGIKYYICENCGHINGEFLETSEFTRNMYEKSTYGKTYYSVEEKTDYLERMQRIYLPKVKFMEEVFCDADIDYNKFKFLDVGAGSGYYVGALANEGLFATGIEVGASQVDYGNKMLGKDCLVCINENEIPFRIESATEDVVSFIGVIEHMIDPHKALKAVRDNKNIKYIFFSVPMLSYSVISEAVSPSVFNRQLGGGHTHIFTDSSLAFLYEKYSLEVLGEWRFGTDMADLFRSTFVKLEQDDNMELSKIFKEHFGQILDEMQLVIDKSKFCSEIHVVAKKCKIRKGNLI